MMNKKQSYNIENFAVSDPQPKEQMSPEMADKKHTDMLTAIKPFARKRPQKNTTPVYMDYKTRDTSLVLVLCPRWTAEFPPFNLARLSAVAKTAGYETSIIDLNVRTYKEFITDWRPNNKVDTNIWGPNEGWKWTNDNYHNLIHPLLEESMLLAVDEILAKNPTVVGFSIYYTAEILTEWMARELKKRKPDLKIIVGGSSVQKSYFNVSDWYDYAVAGEGEALLLEVLEEIENGVVHEHPPFLTQQEDERLNLNGMPMPDYEDINFADYLIPNGVNTEFSRGCTAKCTFCEETHFWKYRQRQAVDLIDEIEWLYYNKGTEVFWFIDSLVNGNLKELRAFCKAVIAKELDIHWTGYSRCDGKMDREFYEDLANSGCIMLNYGCESGSQNVLNAMDKGVTVEEMEQNFRDGHATGVSASTNWIVGFPTESLDDFTQTMQMMWRNRMNSINNFALGTGLSVGSETVIGQNPARFNISDHKYMDHWIADDFSMGGMHVMHRVKSISIFLDAMHGCTENVTYSARPALKKEHYTIAFDDDTVNEIEYEHHEYDIIKPHISPYADTLVNEMWPVFHLLWRVRGGYEIEVLYNPEIDEREFGDYYGPKMFTGKYKFKVDAAGNWDADFEYDLKQDPTQIQTTSLASQGKDPERLGPFIFQEVSRLQTNAARRARKIAKPAWSVEDGRDDNNFHSAIIEEKTLNQAVDFTFDYHYVGSGNWSDSIDRSIKPTDIIARAK